MCGSMLTTDHPLVFVPQMFTDFVDECRAGSKNGNKGAVRSSLMINKTKSSVVDAVKQIAVNA